MTDVREKSTIYRLVTVGFGIFFIAISIAIVLVTERTLGSIVAAAIIGMLGIDAIIAAYRNKQFLLSRIGPLP